MLRLEVTRGRGSDQGRTLACSGVRPRTIGRASTRLHVDDHKVSRRHARIWIEDDQFHIEDLGSRHGTYLNGKRLSGPSPLTPGDELWLGNLVIAVRDATPPSKTPAPVRQSALQRAGRPAEDPPAPAMPPLDLPPGACLALFVDGRRDGQPDPLVGQVLTVQGPAMIGRSEGTLILPDSRVSARHARVYPTGDRWLIADLASRGGTFVNGWRIDRPTPVAEGDRLWMGRFRLTVAAAVVPEPALAVAADPETMGDGDGLAPMADGELGLLDVPMEADATEPVFEPADLQDEFAGEACLLDADAEDSSEIIDHEPLDLAADTDGPTSDDTAAPELDEDDASATTDERIVAESPVERLAADEERAGDVVEPEQEQPADPEPAPVADLQGEVAVAEVVGAVVGDVAVEADIEREPEPEPVAEVQVEVTVAQGDDAAAGDIAVEAGFEPESEPEPATVSQAAADDEPTAPDVEDEPALAETVASAEPVSSPAAEVQEVAVKQAEVAASAQAPAPRDAEPVPARPETPRPLGNAKDAGADLLVQNLGLAFPSFKPVHIDARDQRSAPTPPPVEPRNPPLPAARRRTGLRRLLPGALGRVR